MTLDEIERKTKNVIEEATDISASEIHSESVLMDDLDLSSLEVMAIVAEMEKEFHVRFMEKELMNIVTVDDVVRCVAEKLG